MRPATIIIGLFIYKIYKYTRIFVNILLFIF